MKSISWRLFSWTSVITIGFVAIMIIVGAMVVLLGIVSLVIVSPLIVYKAIKGGYLGSPWRAARRINLSN